MKRAAVLCALVSACGSQSKPLHPPVIVSFTVDNPHPFEGDAVTFSFEVSNATKVSLYPLPGGEATSPVTVRPIGSGSFLLRAENADGRTDQTLGILMQQAPPVRVRRFTALPAQAPVGQDVTLSWVAEQAVRLELSDGSGDPPQDVSQLSSLVVRPKSTTLYALTAYAKEGRTPASHSAFTAARVLEPAQVTSFTADPAAIVQGQATTLSWSGDALSWAVKDDSGNTTTVGLARSLVVRPGKDTQYTLLATGPAGTAVGPSLTVTVTAQPGASFSAAAAAGSQPLRLDAACSGQTCTLSLLAASAVSLRGVALDLPLDATKVSLDPATLSLDAAVFGTASTGRVTLGNGPLQNTLVLGAAREGTGTAVASDAALAAGAHILDFKLTLLPAGGVGKVFDGSGARSWLQNAQGRSANAIAVGTVAAQ